MALASIVFPLPGGPNNKIPLHGVNFNSFISFLWYKGNSIDSSIIYFAYSKPIISVILIFIYYLTIFCLNCVAS